VEPNDSIIQHGLQALQRAIVEAFAANAAASLAACFAMACLVSWPLFKTRRKIILLQFGISTGFCLHYALLEIWAAAAVGALAALQALAALRAMSGVRAKRIGYALALLMIAAGFALWSGPATALSTTAQVLVAVGRMQSNAIALRLLLMSGSLFWALHDFAVGAHIALVADVASVAIGGFALVAISPLAARLRLLADRASCVACRRLSVAPCGC